MNRTSDSDLSDKDLSAKDPSDEDSSDGDKRQDEQRQDEQRRAGLYARVSTGEDRQTPETQLRHLREYADRRGFYVAEEYVDKGSGLDSDRPEYQRLLQDARQRVFDVVLVWRYDRFARSTQALISALKEFQALGIGFISHQEQIDTTTPQGEMVFGFMASLAQFESSLISERVKAGMQRAKEEGTRVGRPPIPEDTQAEVQRLYTEEDVSINKISERLDISYGTAWNYVQEVKGE